MIEENRQSLIKLLMAEAEGIDRLAEIYRERDDLMRYRHYEGRRDGFRRGLAVLQGDNGDVRALIDHLCQDAYEMKELENTYRMQNDVMQYRYYEGLYDGLRRVSTTVVCDLAIRENVPLDADETATGER